MISSLNFNLYGYNYSMSFVVCGEKLKIYLTIQLCNCESSNTSIKGYVDDSQFSLHVDSIK